MFEMIVAAFMMGAPAFWMPMRMIGAIVLGQGAMEPTYSLATAGTTGIVVHMVLSMIYGAIFGAVAAAVPALSRSSTALLVWASIFGFALWVVNFYVYELEDK